MKTLINKKSETQLRIIEHDLVNNEDVLIAQCFVVIENGNTSFNYDIYKAEVFEAKKEDYIELMMDFKRECEKEFIIDIKL